MRATIRSGQLQPRRARISLTRRCVIFLYLASVILVAPGCSWIISSTTNNFAENLSSSILNQSDPGMVEAGAPAYLLLMDAMLQGDPNNQGMLRAAASLNGAYAGLFLHEPQRQKIITQKALDYAGKALCLHNDKTCGVQKMQFEEFSKYVDDMHEDDVPVWYVLGTAWA